MDPFKFPPQGPSLLALGMSSAGGCHLGGGVRGRLGIKNMYLWHLKEAIHSTPRKMKGLYVGTGTIKFCGLLLGSSCQKAMLFLKIGPDFKKQNTHTHKKKNQKGVENFMLKKRSPNKAISSTLHLFSVPAPCNGYVSNAVSFQGKGVDVTPQFSCPHSAGSVFHPLSYIDLGSLMTLCSPNAPFPETCWLLR